MSKALYQYLFEGEVLFSLPNEKVLTVPVSPAGVEAGQAAVEKVSSRSLKEDSPLRNLKSRFLIVVNTYDEGLKENELAFLEKVLQAVNYRLDKVDLFDLNKIQTFDVSAVVRENLVDYFLLLGVRPQELNLAIPLEVYKPSKVNGVWLLLANSLKRMELDVPKKRELWAALKQMFF